MRKGNVKATSGVHCIEPHGGTHLDGMLEVIAVAALRHVNLAVSAG
jgi:hypothetical protein